MKKFFISIATIAVIFGCARIDDNNEIGTEGAPKKVPMTFGSTPDTRSYFGEKENSGYPIYWSEGEKIGIFDGTDINPFTINAGGAGKKTASFSGEAISGQTNYYAIYPYRTDDEATAAGVFTTTLLGDQTATKGTYDPNAIVAVDKTTENGDLGFHNAVAFVKVTIGSMTYTFKEETSIYFNGYYETYAAGQSIDETITTIIISDTDDYLSGKVTVDASSDSPVATIVRTSNSKAGGGETVDGIRSVTLNASSSGVAQGDVYFLTLAPGTYSNLTVSLVSKDGNIYQKKVSGSKTLAVNNVTNIGTLNLNGSTLSTQFTFDGFMTPGTYYFTDGTDSATSAITTDSGGRETNTIQVYVGTDADSSHQDETNGYESLPVSALVVIPVFMNASGDVIMPAVSGTTSPTVTYPTVAGKTISATFNPAQGTTSAYITWDENNVPEGYHPLRAVVYFYGRQKESTGGARGQNFLIFNEDGNLDRTSNISNATLFTGIYPA